jgi:hypothetical protein
MRYDSLSYAGAEFRNETGEVGDRLDFVGCEFADELQELWISSQFKRIGKLQRSFLIAGAFLLTTIRFVLATTRLIASAILAALGGQLWLLD